MFDEHHEGKEIFRILQIVGLIALIGIVTWYIFMSAQYFQHNQKASNNVKKIFNVQEKK